MGRVGIGLVIKDADPRGGADLDPKGQDIGKKPQRHNAAAGILIDKDRAVQGLFHTVEGGLITVIKAVLFKKFLGIFNVLPPMIGSVHLLLG